MKGFADMSEFCIIEGITAVSAVINNTKKNLSNSKRRLTELYFDSDKLKKYDRSMYSRYVFLRESASECGYTFMELPGEELNKIFQGATHGGIGAKCVCPELAALDDTSVKANGFYCYIDGIDDPFNLGYIIRTLYPLGCCGVILSQNNKLSFSPATVIKSSAGITEMIDIFTASPESFCEIMHNNSYKIACAAIRDSIPSDKADFTPPIALVIGGEKRGISRKILEQSDMNVRIEYAIPFNGSLPSVCAASLLAYDISRFLKK